MSKDNDYFDLEKRLGSIQGHDFEAGDFGEEKDIGFFGKLADIYFRPKEFEKSGKLYEKFGVKKFQKLYFATAWRIASLIKKDIKWVSGTSRRDLESFEDFTRFLEGMHVASSPPFLCGFIYQVAQEDYVGATMTFAMNTVVNVYPIMLQRYNRTRVYRILENKRFRD